MSYQYLEELGVTLKRLLGADVPDKEIGRLLEELFSSAREINPQNATEMFNQILIQSQRTDGLVVEAALEPLHHAYQTYLRGGKGRNKDFVGWLATTKGARVHDFFKIATNVDLGELQKAYRLSKSRLIDVRNIPRPRGYQKFYDDVIEILGDQDDKIAALLDLRPQDVKAIKLYQETGKLPETLFWRIKGRMTELLAEPMKKQILADRLEEGIKSVKRLEGVRAQTTLTKAGDVVGTGGFREIWDGIVVEFSDDGLRILDIIEIKSGKYGHDTGLEQVLATYLTRFTTYGDELLVTLPDGTRRIFTKKPGETGAGLIDDTAANFHVIAPTGESMVVANQRLLFEQDQVINTINLTLNDRDVSHLDLDALVLDFLWSREL